MLGPLCSVNNATGNAATQNRTCDDGAYWVDPSGDGQRQQIYCDMTSDGGGWSLFITLDPQGAAAATPQDWPTTVSITADVESTGMYGANFAPLPSRPLEDKTLSSVYASGLWRFSEVREEIASGLVVVYGKGLSAQDIATVVDQYGYLSRSKALNRPSCQYDLEDTTGTTVMKGCAENPGGIANSLLVDSLVVGWALNPRGFPKCFFGAGQGAKANNELGSFLCPGVPDGRAWSKVWFRESEAEALSLVKIPPK